MGVNEVQRLGARTAVRSVFYTLHAAYTDEMQTVIHAS